MTALNGQNKFHFYRGRVALCVLLRALGLKPGDEVLLQAFTCLAVPAPIVGLGLKPVYVDIDRATYNMDLKQARQRITDGVKGIIVQHTFGNPADMDAVLALAKEHGLAIIEDCCHVLGSRYGGRELGSFGDAAFYSYEWGKPVVIGIGGVAVVHSPQLLERVRGLAGECIAPPLKDVWLIHLQYLAHRMLRRPRLFWTIRGLYHLLSRTGLLIGNFSTEEFRGTLSDEYRREMPRSLQARLLAELHRAQHTIAQRKLLANQYEQALHQLGIECVKPPKSSDAIFLRYPFLARNKTKVLAEAKKRKIELGDWFRSPIHPLTEDQWNSMGYQKGTCPIAEQVSSQVASLPVYSAVAQNEVERALVFLTEMRDRGLI